MNTFEGDLNFFNKMIADFDEASIINEIMKQGIVPIINNSKLVSYQIKPNSKFDELKNSLLNELSEFYTIFGVYDIYNVHIFNTSYSHFVSLAPISIEDAKRYQCFNELSEDVGNDKLEFVYNYLKSEGFKACTIQNYPRLYQIMNLMNEKIDLDIIAKTLCKFINTDYDYNDVMTTKILSKTSDFVSDWETSKEEKLTLDQRIEMINKLYSCLDITKLDNYDYKDNKELVLSFACRNTEILNSVGFRDLTACLNARNKVMIKKY